MTGLLGLLAVANKKLPDAVSEALKASLRSTAYS